MWNELVSSDLKTENQHLCYLYYEKVKLAEQFVL